MAGSLKSFLLPFAAVNRHSPATNKLNELYLLIAKYNLAVNNPGGYFSLNSPNEDILFQLKEKPFRILLHIPPFSMLLAQLSLEVIGAVTLKVV